MHNPTSPALAATPNLYMIPNLLGGGRPEDALPAGVMEIVGSVKKFLVEDERSARKFLKLCGIMPPFEGIELATLDKHTTRTEKETILKEWAGQNIGLLSEAGCPAIADPGNDIVAMARGKGWKIKPLVGPSSVLLAIIGSGFSGQMFTFHGYLPVQSDERMRRLRELESTAEHTGYTQVFIETPFRNEGILADIIRGCKGDTWISIGCDLTLETEEIITLRASELAKRDLKLKGRPCVFSIWVPARHAQEGKGKYERKGRGTAR